MGISIESTFVTFVSLVWSKKMAQIFFSLLLFNLFLHPPEKENLCFFCYTVWDEEYWQFPLNLPLLHLFHFVTGKTKAQIFWKSFEIFFEICNV